MFWNQTSAPDGKQSRCIDCAKKDWKSWSIKNPEVHRRLKSNYGITLEEYTSRATAQNYQCAICQRTCEKMKLYIDHDHKTGKLREFLCINCNTLLGHARDEIPILEKAIEYLRKHNDR